MSAGHGPSVRDPAAQPERTRFAWRRSTLTFAVAVALAVRHAVYAGGGMSPAEAAAAGTCVLACLVFLVTAHRRITAMAQPRTSGMGAGVALCAALCTLATVAVGAVLLLW